MIDLTLKKEQTTTVVCHTQVPGMSHKRHFQVGESYELEVNVKYYSNYNTVWILYDGGSRKFKIDNTVKLPSVIMVYTDYFIDMETYRESEINKVLEL
tara:strand:+ start:38584 stop:38877 length:294 start_codon:yes stop_codon:yes gene_type:complete